MKSFFIMCMLLCTQALYSQSINIFDIDTTNFPSMKAKFFAFDKDGNQVRPSISELGLKENGISRTITNVNCPPPAPPKALSSVLVIDVSGSMSWGSGSTTNMDLAKAAARAWVNALPLGASECAITSFDGSNYLNQDFTTNRTKLLNAISPLQPQGGTDYDAALLNPMAGGVLVSKNGKYQKVIVFLTDGQASDPQINTIVSEANRQNCIVYCVTLGMSAPQSVKDIASRTGGQVFENVTTIQEAEDVYKKILQVALGGTPCTIEWQSGISCTAGSTAVELSWQSEKSQSAYATPVNAIAALQVSPSSVRFGKRIPNTSHDTTITLTARDADFTVTGINRTFGSADFTIVNTIFPFTILKNQSRTITLRFVPNDSNRKYVSFEINTDKCLAYFSVIGGFPGKKMTTSTLKVLHPNGGEQFVAGSDTLITWNGVAPTDTVRLDYSIDKGKSWRTITDKAATLQYKWMNIPLPSSVECLVRARQLSDDSLARSIKDSLIATLKGHNNRVMESVWSPDGLFLASGGDDGSIKIWDAVTFEEVKTLTGHKGGVTSLDWSPDGIRLVSGSLDSTVKIWDAVLGTNLFTFKGHNHFVECVSWSPDGKKIASGSRDATINILSPQGKLLRTLRGHTFAVRDVAWHPDAVKLASGSADYTIKIWDTNKGIENITIREHKDWVWSVSWHPNGQKIVSGCDDGSVIIWDANTGKNLQTLSSWGSVIWSVSWSPNGKKIVSVNEYGDIDIFDDNGTKINRLRNNWGDIYDVSWHPENYAIVCSRYNGTVDIWGIENFFNILQQDQSDAVFSIVAPQAIARNIDLGQVLVGSRKDSVVADVVRNTGTYPFEVDSIYFRGADAGAFALVSGTPRYTVPSGTNKYGEFRFAPLRTGVHTAQIVIITQADTLLQTIRGEGIAPSLAVVNNLIDFGVVDVGKSRDSVRAVTIRNSGTSPLTINSTRHDTPNAVDFTTLAGGGSFTLQSGDTARLDLRFKPSEAGRTSGRLLFDYNGLGSPAVVQLFGEGIKKNPKILSTATLFDDVVCETERKSNVEIKNEGGSDLIISEINIAGANNLDFIINQSLPITIMPDSSYSFPITFRPQTSGNKVAELEIKSNADPDSVYSILLTALKESTDWGVDTTVLDYGDIQFNETPALDFQIRNNGTLKNLYSIISSLNLSLSEKSIELNAQESKKVTVQYLGSAFPDEIKDSVVVQENICKKTQTIVFSGTVFSAFASLQSPNKSGYAGEEIEIPIQLTSQQNIAQSGITSIDIDMTFNPTLLSPIGYTVEIINDTLGKISMKNIAIIAENGRILHTLRCKVGLGNAEDCLLELSNLTLHGGNANINLVNGSFTLLGICEEGGTRLINPGKATTLMRIHPNPSKGIMNVDLELIEQGLTILRIYDVQGSVIAEREFHDNIGTVQSVFDITQYGAGMYYIEVRTPTMIRKEKIVIEK